MAGPARAGEQGAAIDRYRMDPLVRRYIRNRVAEQVRAAWSLAGIAGTRLAPWARHDNRELVLEQRLDALSDGELFELWDGRCATCDEPAPEVTRYDVLTCGRIELRFPITAVTRH